MWTVSLLGDGVRTFALPLYVALTTGDPLAMSAVAVAGVIPWLLTALPAGAFVDRLRPKTVLMVAQLVRATVLMTLVVLIVADLDYVLALCAVAFTITLTETFAYPASQVLMVELAGRDQLNEANSRFYMVQTVGMLMVGPLAGGALVALRAELAFGLVGLLFVVAPILLAGLPRIEPKAPTAKLRAGVLAGEVGEGVRLLFAIRGLRTIVAVVGPATIAVGAVNALLALYAVETLQMPTGFVSLLLVVAAIGTLVASRSVVPLARRWPAGAVLIASLAAAAVGMVVLGAAPFVVAALVANLLIGAGLGGFNVLAAARRQRLTPSEAMGRISSSYRVLTWGIMPIGAGLAGPLAKITSLGAVFVIAGCLVLVVLAVLARPLLSTDEPAADTGASVKPSGAPAAKPGTS